MLSYYITITYHLLSYYITISILLTKLVVYHVHEDNSDGYWYKRGLEGMKRIDPEQD